MCDNQDTAGVPGTVSEKLALLQELVGELAQQDWASLPATVQDQAIRAMEKAEAGQAAIRGAALAAFADGPGCSWYGQQSITSFLVAETGVTRSAARAHQGWARRHRQHPLVAAALARTQISASLAARICGWSDQLPSEHQATADEILLTACLGGCGIGDLTSLAVMMREELAPDDDAKPPAPGVTVQTTLDGAGVLHGELSPGVTALVKAAFEKYGARQGTEDQRTLAERQHAALGEICRQVLSLAGQPADGEDLADCEEPEDGDAPAEGTAGKAAGKAAGRRMRPVTALVHINLADVLDLPGAPGMAWNWTRHAAAAWAGENARNSAEPGYGGAWLTGAEAVNFTSGTQLTPVVTGCPDTSVIPDLAAAGARLHALLQAEQHGEPTDQARKHGLAADLLGYAIKALSGPGGVGSFIRTRLFAGTVLGSGSLALDVGRSREIPRQLRIAIALRDRTCSWAGCDRPAIKAEPHHVIHYADGGLTNPENLKTYCYFHHHLVLHQRGWTGQLRPDGTIDIYRPDGTQYVPGTRYQPPQRE